jgi:hypothetical protein
LETGRPDKNPDDDELKKRKFREKSVEAGGVITSRESGFVESQMEVFPRYGVGTGVRGASARV